MNVLIGTPIHPQGAYALDKFLANQKEIQQEYPACELLFSTADFGFVEELKGLISRWGIRGKVIHYQVEKPVYAKSRLWNIACGREVIRQYVLSQTKAQFLLFLDADMTFDTSVISILVKEINGYDAVFSGYRLRTNELGLAGAGCLLLARKALEKIKIRCCEFKNGEVIYEDNLIEMDLFRRGGRIKKGFFLSIDHYAGPDELKHTDPQKVSLSRKIRNYPLLRYGLIKTSVILQRNIPWKLMFFSSQIRNIVSRVKHKFTK